MSNTEVAPPDVKIIPPLIYLAGLGAGILFSLWFPTRLVPRLSGWASGAIFALLGLALVIPALHNFRRTGTPIRPDRAATALITTGPYHFTRNPMYAGLAAVYIGIAIAVQSLWALLLLPIVLLIIRYAAIEKEEAFLSRRFGVDYQQYKARVRRWL